MTSAGIISAWVRRAALACLGVLLAAVSPGQIVTGSISGTVEDPSGAAVPGASVVLRNPEAGLERRATTNELGRFLFVGLPAGSYAVTLEKEGFKRLERSGVVLTTGENLSLGRLVLELGRITEEVSVTGAALPVRVESSENAEIITTTQAEYLPVLGRSPEILVTLVPGVVNPGGQPETFSGGADYRALGSRSRSNSISIDGVVVTDADSGGGKRLSVSQEAVSEIKILISNYQAEYGRMSGSNLEVVTKSGTRDFHGGVSYFKRHEQFNAANFFENFEGRSKARYRYNTLSYSLSGPLLIPRWFNTKRDKVFFFWSQEYWPAITSSTVRRTMPTERERAGDFSQSVDQSGKLIVIRDPFGGQLPFPGNVVPASRINPSGQALLKVLPLPNFLDWSVSKGAYNYIYTDDIEQPERTDTLKIDYNLTSDHRLTGSYSGYYGTVQGHFFSGGNSNWPQVKGNYKMPTRMVLLRDTFVVSPSVVVESHTGWLHRDETNSIDRESLRRNQRAAVGFTVGQFHPEINPLDLLPNATFGGVPNAPQLGYDGRFPYDFFQNLVNIDNKVSVVRGRHQFKAGVYAEYFDRNMPVQGLIFNGQFDFGRSTENPLDTGYAFANALLGIYQRYREATAKPRMHTRSWAVDFFVQDNLKHGRRLSLDFGMRFGWRPWVWDRDNLLAGFVWERYDPAKAVSLLWPARIGGQRVAFDARTGKAYPAVYIGAVAFGSGDPYNGMVVPAWEKRYPRALAEDPGLLAMPRFGFAWDLFGNGASAVRGGLGVFYNREAMAHFYKWSIAQPPLVATPELYYGTLPELLLAQGIIFPSSVLARDPKQKPEYTINFSFGIEQRLLWQVTGRAYYVGAVGRHLAWRRYLNPIALGANFDPLNQDPTSPGKPMPPAFLRPIRGYQDIYYYEGAASSNYHSLQVSAQRRMVRGLQFGAAWTWSKAMDYNEDPRATAAGATVSAFIRPRVWNYGPMSWDRTHVCKIYYVWEIPRLPRVGKFGRIATTGWRFSGITTFQSGAPLGVDLATTVAMDFTGTPSQEARVLHVGKTPMPKDQRTFYRFFNTESVAMPPIGSYGNAAKVLFRGPGQNNWDLALYRDLDLGERLKLQFRWEMYNAFNHTQFSGVDTTARFDPQGKQVNARFGQLTSAWPSRRMQLGLRLSF